MNLEQNIESLVVEAIQSIYKQNVAASSISLTETKPDFEGNITLVVFQLLKQLKGKPEEIGTNIGQYLVDNSTLISDFNVVKGFLNLVINPEFWSQFLITLPNDYWQLPPTGSKIVLEYCGPNTNKPLHLGHIRNMLLGWSIAEILLKAGNDVHKVNIYNDRGIAICKSMVAWREFADDATPESTGIKGDHFVGNYYVRFARVEQEQAQYYLNQGMEPREANKLTAINKAAQEELRQWEEGNPSSRGLWHKMNSWVYAGFDETFVQLGVDFEKNYYESKTYLIGKDIVQKGLKDGLFYQKEDGSVWVDLEDKGLDQKLLLRADGTSVYITQDLGTAQERYEDFKMDRSIYVVGNEQDYHFQVLKAVEQKMNSPFADGIEHLSYGMVDLPDGKMKSREGTVVDADDLIIEMNATAKAKTQERGQVDELSASELNRLYHQLGMGALKFFILRVDPQKRILFNPSESIEFQGFTGPFIQYTYARIQSLLRKAGSWQCDTAPNELTSEEINVIQHIYDYQKTLSEAARLLAPSIMANYAFKLAKLFNQFYEQVPVLKEENANLRAFRLQCAKQTAETLKQALHLLGIEAPNQM